MDILYITGFRSRRRDIEEPAAPAPSDQAHDDGADHSPDPHDEEFHVRPDEEAMDAAIADFLRRSEDEEQRGYPALDRMLSRLPIPGKVDQRGLSVSDAIDAGMLPRMDEEEARPEFKPAEIANDLHGQIRYIHGIL